MKTYAVEFTKKAQKELKKIDPDYRLRISKAIYNLTKNPRAGNVRPLVGSDSWRLKVGVYRLIYDIKDQKLIVYIIRIRHRRDVYKGL